MQAFIDYINKTYLYRDGDLYNHSGKKLGWVDGNYKKMKIKGKDYRVHRIIYAMHHGYFPKDIDHIDTNKLNNRIENLRDCPSRSHNAANTHKQKNNTSGYKGVTKHKNKDKWQASLFYRGKRIYIGIYDCKLKAARAYNEKSLEIFGEFARINDIKEI